MFVWRRNRLTLAWLVCAFAASLARAQPEVVTLELPGASVHLLIEDEPFDIGRDALQDWVQRSAQIVGSYYGRFPVGEAHVAIRGRRGSGVYNGRAFGTVGAVVNITIGVNSTQAQLDDDWILIHELIHFAFPSVPRRHHWIEEGLSVYVETIARANAGALTPSLAWDEFMGGMPQGLPKSGDRGLDYTPTWGRTYWGGALFCLLADVRIRQQTDGEFSLRDGLRAIVSSGYNITQSAELRTVLAVADAATGVTVLTELYDDMRAAPYPADIDGLWQALGVSRQADRIVFDDQAPLVAIRDSITARDF